MQVLCHATCEVGICYDFQKVAAHWYSAVIVLNGGQCYPTFPYSFNYIRNKSAFLEALSSHVHSTLLLPWKCECLGSAAKWYIFIRPISFERVICAYQVGIRHSSGSYTGMDN